MNKENQPEIIEVDDTVRQADYKYTYSDRSNTTLKSEQADMLVQAVERFKQAGLEVNLPEIFVWYFEQKGVENAERFLGLGVNNNELGLNPINLPMLQMLAQNLINKSTETEKPLKEIESRENIESI